MTAAICVRIEPVSKERYSGRRRHDLRIGRIPGYIDTDRSSANSVLVEARKLDDHIAHLSAIKAASRCRKKAVPRRIAYAGILTFSHDAQEKIADLSQREIDRRIKASIDAIASTHHVDISSLVVHRDEAALHAHFMLSSVKNDGSGSALRLAPKDTSALQDIAAAPWADLSITRGTSIGAHLSAGNVAATIHRSVRELHRDLPKELAALEKRRAAAAERLRKIESILAKEMSYYRSISTQQQRDEELVRLRAEKNELLNTFATLKEREKKLSAITRSFVKKLNSTDRPVVEKNLGRLGLADVIPPPPVAATPSAHRRVSHAQTR